MPFASEAQRRKFYAMAERGEISKGKVKEYEKETRGDLPERVKAKGAKARDKARKFNKKAKKQQESAS